MKILGTYKNVLESNEISHKNIIKKKEKEVLHMKKVHDFIKVVGLMFMSLLWKVRG